MNWKEIEGFEGRFSISDCGIIKNELTGKELKTTVTRKGYHQVSTKPFGRNGKTKVFKIHREVALAFLPNPDGKPTVNHIDGDKDNNHISNLEWATVKENIQHAFDNNLSNNKGNRNPASKIDINIAEQIKKEYIPKHREYGARALGRKYGLCHQHISRIANGIYWS